MVKDFFGKEPSHTINPDEAVAMGAAIQSGIISGSLEEVLLLDVTPLSLGIEVEGGLFSVLIPRNSSIPTTATKRFTTVSDYQLAVRIHVLQGERKIAKENRTLAHFRLTGITEAPKEVPEVEVQFLIDANGILKVSAKDISSGSAKEIVVEEYGTLPDTEITKMIDESVDKTQEDNLYVQKIQQEKQAEMTSSVFREFLEKEKGKLEEKDAVSIGETVAQLDVALAKKDFDEVRQCEKTLREIGAKYPELFYIYITLNKD